MRTSKEKKENKGGSIMEETLDILREQIRKLEAEKKEKLDLIKKKQEKKELERQIFELKHGDTIQPIRNILGNLKAMGESVAQSISENKSNKIECMNCGRKITINEELSSNDTCSKCGGKFKKI